MSSTENLIKATINTLKSRAGKQLLESATKVIFAVKDAPERLQTEWGIFHKEIVTEAARLEKLERKPEESNYDTNYTSSGTENIQNKIDSIREKIVKINRNLEDQIS